MYFVSPEQLNLEMNDYIHGTLGYLTPIEFKQQPSILIIQFNADIPI